MAVVSPPKPPSPDELQALIEEARGRQRRRRLITAFILLGVISAGLVAEEHRRHRLRDSPSAAARCDRHGPSAVRPRIPEWRRVPAQRVGRRPTDARVLFGCK